MTNQEYKQVNAYCNICATEKDKTYLGQQEAVNVLDDLALYNCKDCGTTSAYKLKDSYIDRELNKLASKLSYAAARKLLSMRNTMGFDSLPVTFKYIPKELQKVVYNAAKEWNDEKLDKEVNRLHLESIIEHENKRKNLKLEQNI